LAGERKEIKTEDHDAKAGKQKGVQNKWEQRRTCQTLPVGSKEGLASEGNREKKNPVFKLKTGHREEWKRGGKGRTDRRRGLSSKKRERGR